MRGFLLLPGAAFQIVSRGGYPNNPKHRSQLGEQGVGFVAHVASYSNRRLPGGRPHGARCWIRSKSYRTPSPRVVLPLMPCIWSHQGCGKHRRCRDRSALGCLCIEDMPARTSAA
ncbi:conserved hypothetical protein [Xanthomonas citri pv. aurantifolii str. ICPB 11122]|nr:conserved hypothetical protein [Xanthomonas citri pv. aurantifolii str. ICPB 11122]